MTDGANSLTGLRSSNTGKCRRELLRLHLELLRAVVAQLFFSRMHRGVVVEELSGMEPRETRWKARENSRK